MGLEDLQFLLNSTRKNKSSEVIIKICQRFVAAALAAGGRRLKSPLHHRCFALIASSAATPGFKSFSRKVFSGTSTVLR